MTIVLINIFTFIILQYLAVGVQIESIKASSNCFIGVQDDHATWAKIRHSFALMNSLIVSLHAEDKTEVSKWSQGIMEVHRGSVDKNGFKTLLQEISSYMFHRWAKDIKSKLEKISINALHNVLTKRIKGGYLISLGKVHQHIQRVSLLFIWVCGYDS